MSNARLLSVGIRRRWPARPIIVRRKTTVVGTAKQKPHLPSKSVARPSSFLQSNSPFMNKPRPPFNASLSQMSGHGSFVLAVGAYLATDILDLRCMVLGATTLGMVFQYYRPVPLTIPLKWNTLLLGINLVMASSLYMERKRAEEMDGEMVQLYRDGSFEERGFSRVEFCRLFCIGKKKTLKVGDMLAQEGKPNTKMYLLVGGNVVIKSGGKRLAIATPHQFIGEMTFLDFMLGGVDSSASEATADVIVNTGGATVWEWDFGALRSYLRDQHEVANALQAYISHDLRSKLADSNMKMVCRSYTKREWESERRGC